MKLVINLLIVILINSLLTAQECKSGIRINSDTEELLIFINDSLEYYNTYSIDLDQGFYNITILENSDRWDAKSYTDSFYIDSCTIKNIEINFRDQLLINSTPQDAMVFVEDSLIGFTPLLLYNSVSNITLKKNGYAENQLSINSSSSQLNVQLEFIGQTKKVSFFDKDISKILFASMIALGATTAYFKIKADNSFDEYLRTGNTELKDRTNQYDLVSGITLGLTQINFGFLIYKIFSDN